MLKNPHPKIALLRELISQKESPICVAADVSSSAELLLLADTLGPQICLLKTHIDILRDYTPAVARELMRLRKQHGFLIFEDRKFADIGQTCREQFLGGLYKISEWADFVTVHGVAGPLVLQAFSSVPEVGLLLLAQMSSAGNLMSHAYTQEIRQMALECPQVAGFIAQEIICPGFLHLTPGVSLQKQHDDLGQRYRTPRDVLQQGVDLLIVGRDVTCAPNPLEALQAYREQASLAVRCISSKPGLLH